MKRLISQSIRVFGRILPDYLYIRAIPNRILKPIHKWLNLDGGIVPVQNFQMRLNPSECVDGWLWFSPQLYDRKELDFLTTIFPEDGFFVDAGANIGFWSLTFAHRFEKAKILAVEANPSTFSLLKENVELNNRDNVALCNVGISDESSILPLYCNTTGNRGGDSFSSYANQRLTKVDVPVEPLLNILNSFGIKKIDVMKMDIEGFEEKVLRHFFITAPKGLWPKYICIEVLHAPQVAALLENNGYLTRLQCRENTVFELPTSN